ncbi:MAG: HAD family hydrolase [Patescibacteria group bacterium]
MIQLIIFDFYGVIIKGSYKDTSRWLAKKYKKPFDKVYKILYHKYFNQAAEGKINERQFFIRTLKELGFEEKWQTVQAKHISYLILDKQALKFAKNLQDQGIKVVFLSKNTPAQVEIILKKYKIRRHIKHFINTYDLGLPKADKRTIRHILKRFKVKPGEAVMIDDQDFNLVEPKKLGVKTILYKNFGQMRKELGKYLRD